MTTEMQAIDRYVDEVTSHLPPAIPERGRVASDLRAHLLEAASASGSAEEAVREMGPPRETAAAYAEELDLEPASLADRAGAFLLDVGLAVPPILLLFMIEPPLPTDPSLDLTTVGALTVVGMAGLLSLLYFPALEYCYGQTLGKRIFGLCVARDDGLRVGWWKAVVRRLPLFFEVFWLDALVAPFTERRQRAFDLVAGTVVVPGEESGGRLVGWAVALALWSWPALNALSVLLPASLALLPG